MTISTKIAEGQEVVIMDVYTTGPLAPGGIPIQHNSRNSPAHPCRGRRSEGWDQAGARRDHRGSLEGSPIRPRRRWPVPVPIETAKRLYREGLESHRAWRTDESIAQCVESP